MRRFSHFSTISLTASGVLLASLLTACANPELRTDVQSVSKEVLSRLPREGNIRGSVSAANEAAQKQASPSVMKSSKRSWVGSVMIPVNADDKLPQAFSKEYVLNFADGVAPLPLSMIAARLSQIVEMPVRVQPDVFEQYDSGGTFELASGAKGNGAGQAAATGGARSAASNQVPLTVAAANMNWRGPLTGFLDHLTNQLGLSWEYRDGSIVIMRFTTELYELATFPNEFKYNLSSGSAGTSGSDSVKSNSALSIAEQGNVNSLKSIVSVVEKVIQEVPGSSATLAEGSGRLMVRTSKQAQSIVRGFIRAENNNMLRQVQIQLDIYSVTTTRSNELGVDWSAFYQSLSNNFNLGLTSPASLTSISAGAIAARILPAPGANPNDVGQRFANSVAVINALNQIGDNVQHRPISLVALNRQWARKARLNTTGYLSETKPAPVSALGGTGGVPGLTTDSITTGDQYAVMPFVLENNTILLKMGMSLSDLLGLFEVTTGSGATLQRVQTPNTTSISDQYTIALRPGETMAITGLSRDASNSDDRRLGNDASLALGGARINSLKKEEFVVLIRAVIL